MTTSHSSHGRMGDCRVDSLCPRIGIILWSGEYGGAETWSLALAHALVRRKIRVTLLIIGSREPLFKVGTTGDLHVEAMRLRRGRDVVRHSNRLSVLVQRLAPDAVILPSAGFLSAVLRIGGYRGRVVAIEHGSLRNLRNLPLFSRAARLVSELSGIWAVDAQVTPSDFMKREVLRYPHSRIVRRIYPGLDWVAYGWPASVAPLENAMVPGLRLGFAGRLIHGKGVETLLRGFAESRPTTPMTLQIAGDGPEMSRLVQLSSNLGIADRVNFLGWVADMPSFWRSRDLAVVPSHEWEESFGMVAAEAMARGLPVLASQNGGLEEIIQNGITGALFPCGDWRALARELDRYSADPSLIATQGEAALRHARATFDIDRCAEQFDDLISSLLRDGKWILGDHSRSGADREGVLAS